MARRRRQSEHFIAERVPLPRWQLRHRDPRVLLAQVRPPLAVPDGRFRIAHESRYVAELLALIRTARELEADFTVFPEYACPFAARRELISTVRENASEGTAYILPFEHLTITEYDQLINDCGVAADVVKIDQDDIAGDVPEPERTRAIVNACLWIVKSDGVFHVYPQRKLRPAMLEEVPYTKQWRFASGRRVRVLHGADASVAALICFDLIARDGATPETTESRPRQALVSPQNRVDILFVPEFNPSPLHTSYVQAALALFEKRPILRICVANVARDTVLLAAAQDVAEKLRKSQFGFSRVIGDLGDTAIENESAVRLIKGLVASETAMTLDEAGKSTDKVRHERIRTAIARREKSVILAKLPVAGQQTDRNPETGRAKSSVDVYRLVDDTLSNVRTVPETPPRQEATGIPHELLPRHEIFGANDDLKDLEQAYWRSLEPIWITGEGGVGKTTLVAKFLQRVAADERILWIDMGQLQEDEGALRETILRAAGTFSALTAGRDEQIRIMEEELRRKPTVLVLDSFERWKQPLPEWMEVWPSFKLRVIVTSRRDRIGRGELLEIAPLTEADAHALITNVAGVRPSDEYLETMYKVTGGKALGCVWAGDLYRTARDVAERLPTVLATSTTDNLHLLFAESVRGLSDLARATLGVICTLPSPVHPDDLASILGVQRNAIDTAIDALRERTLLMRSPSPGATEEGYHFRHPFVREFWRRLVDGDVSISSADLFDADAIRQKVLDWQESILEAHGYDRNWLGLRELERRWVNLGYMIRQLREEEKERFLKFWRLADTFLWSCGRWRERIELGIRAEGLARTLGRTDLLVHALYESRAQAEWHLHRDRAAAEPLISEAAQLAAELNDPDLQSRVEWYRSRMLLKCASPEEALDAARTARNLATTPHTQGLAENGIANALLKMGRHEAAEEAYLAARRLFSESGDREMQAVVNRNLGRVHIETGNHAAAVKELEAAIDALREMQIPMEEAEASLSYARVLGKIGEREDALRELRRAEAMLVGLGSAVRNQEIEAARREIERAASDVSL